jgi:hypothetical protein
MPFLDRRVQFFFNVGNSQIITDDGSSSKGSSIVTMGKSAARERSIKMCVCIVVIELYNFKNYKFYISGWF